MTCSTCASRAPLCAACRAQRRAWTIGQARERGVAWAARVRSQRPGEAWPAWEASPRVRARAAELVRDLGSGDELLTAELAQACAAAAARAYARPPPAPGGVAFRAGG